MGNSVIAVLRAIHIAFGAFWLGGLISAGFVLLPVIKTAGLRDRQHAVRLIVRTRLLAVLAVAGVVSVLAGVLLYHDTWAETGHTGPARWYAIGGYFSIAAIILMATAALPTGHKLGRLAHAQAGQEASETAPSQNDRIAQLLSRMTWVTQFTAALLTITIVLMAVARYLT